MSKNKKEQRLNTVLNCALSFFLPALLLLVACVALRITPFGDHNLALTDGKYYLNGLLYHARMLQGQEGFLYSFNNGLGGNEWSSLAWGGLNPVLLLTLFADIDSIPAWFTAISIANMSACGLTMYVLIAYVRGHRKSNLLFSTSYALMGFNVVNCFQTLFFIGPQVLPLMVMGLVKLLRGKSPLLYIVSFAVCTFFNFYFGFMLAVASVVICLAFLYVRRGEPKNTWARHPIRTYAISSFIGGFLPSFFWLPALKAFTGGGRIEQTGVEEYLFSENAPFIQIFSKLYSGAINASEMINGLPNIFCGMLVVALVVLYFMNNNVSTRRKRAVGAILVFYLITFYIIAFGMAMHGFTHTNWFPFRYSFVFSFFLVCIAAEEFRFINELTVRDAKRCGIAILIATILVFSTKYEFVSGGVVLLDLALLVLMWAALCLRKKHPDKMTRRLFGGALMLLVSANLFANYAISIHKLQEEPGWELDLNTYANNTMIYGPLVEGLKLYDHDFFRMEKEFSESGSVGVDPQLYDYNGVSASGPTMRMFVHTGLSKLGISWFDMRHWYTEGVLPATDSLLGLRYILAENDLEEQKGYERLSGVNETYIYKNPNELPIAILSNSDCQGVELDNDAFENLNKVWAAMTGGKDNIFVEQKDVTFSIFNTYSDRVVTSSELDASISKHTSESEMKSGSKVQSSGNQENSSSGPRIEYRFTAKQNGPIYMFNSDIPESNNGAMSPCSKFVGVYKAGDEVSGHLDVGGAITTSEIEASCSKLLFAYADDEVLSKYAKELQSRSASFNVTDHETCVQGEFTAEVNQRILFTIPWDEGWTCYIDGEQVPIDKTWDLFMSVEAPEGSHSYEMRFFPAWMNYGLVISGMALVALVIYMALWHRGRRKSAQMVGAVADSGASSGEMQDTPSQESIKEIKAVESSKDGESDQEAVAGQVVVANVQTENPGDST